MRRGRFVFHVGGSSATRCDSYAELIIVIIRSIVFIILIIIVKIH